MVHNIVTAIVEVTKLAIIYLLLIYHLKKGEKFNMEQFDALDWNKDRLISVDEYVQAFKPSAYKKM